MQSSPLPETNLPVFGVTEIAQAIRKNLEDGFSHVRVRGELSRVKLHSSGHLYTTLKDENANLDAVCWRGQVSKLGLKPEEGLEVICTGRISAYPPRSSYQLIIETMEIAGEGALLKMLEERKKKLASEGLFEQERKKDLPFLPEVIGVVTSPTGAVIRDILHRVQDRFPRHVLLWPVLVQGPGAAEQVAAAIDGFNALESGGAVPRPDILIVARGGGSLEDLLPFSEEIVVRAAAASAIPLISAIGHETDTTLIDYAADRRAPTPTGAAEIAVPVRDELRTLMDEWQYRLTTALARLSRDRNTRLLQMEQRLGRPERILEPKMQRLDHAAGLLERALRHNKDRHEARQEKIVARLVPPRNALRQAGFHLQQAAQNLGSAGQRLIPPRRDRLQATARLLDSLSFHAVLNRGFVLVRDENGHPLTSPENLGPGQNVALEFAGPERVPAQIRGERKPAQKARPHKAKAPPNQGHLF